MHRELLHIGHFTLYSFGMMVILGFIAGALLASAMARKRGLPGEAFMDGAMVMLFAGVAGARLLFVLLNWKDYAGHLGDVAAIWKGGMSFHGGLIAGIAAGILYVWRRKLPILAMADAGAPGLALGYAIGRIGCLLNGCCYGVPTHLPWALPGIYCEGGDPHLTYHPAQVYATILNLALCAALAAAYRWQHRSGQILALYLGGYSIYRFAIEGLRKGVTAEVAALGLTQAQVFSLFSLAAAALWWLWLQRHSAPAPDLEKPDTEGTRLHTGKAEEVVG